MLYHAEPRPDSSKIHQTRDTCQASWSWDSDEESAALLHLWYSLFHCFCSGCRVQGERSTSWNPASIESLILSCLKEWGKAWTHELVRSVRTEPDLQAPLTLAFGSSGIRVVIPMRGQEGDFHSRSITIYDMTSREFRRWAWEGSLGPVRTYQRMSLESNTSINPAPVYAEWFVG